MGLPDRVPTFSELPVLPDAPPKSSWGVFGRDDQLGTLNFLTGERRLAAAQLVKRGAVFNLDLPLHLPFPAFFPQRSTYRRTQIAFPSNRGRDDCVDNFWLQCSSQWDSLKHIRHPQHGFYNWTSDQQVDSEHDGRLGIDNFSGYGIVGRGVLLDVARFLEARHEPLRPHERREFSVELMQEVARTQGVRLGPGDVLMFRTGMAVTVHEEGKEPEQAIRPSPGGPGLRVDDEMLAWLWDSQVAAVVSDNLAVEAWPAVGDRSLHREGIALLGLVLGELFDLEALAADCAAGGIYECLFMAKPLNMRGAVGSPANAMAMK